MAAATAEVTSMPGVFAPTVAARIELILIAGVEGLKIEDVLIASYLLSGESPSRTPTALRVPGEPCVAKRRRVMADEGEVEPRGRPPLVLY
jgi:hypothetical protein